MMLTLKLKERVGVLHMVRVREGLLGWACGMSEVQRCQMVKGLICPAHESQHILTEESLEGFRIRFVC